MTDRPHLLTSLTRHDAEASRWLDVAMLLNAEPTGIVCGHLDMILRHDAHHANASTVERRAIYRHPDVHVMLLCFYAAEAA